MKFLVLCSLIACAIAAPGGIYGGYGLGHGLGYGGISYAAAPVAVAAPTFVKSYAPAPVVVQAAPTIVKAVAPAATSYATFSQVHVSHPAPVAIAHAAPVAVAHAAPVAVAHAAPAFSVAQPVIKYAAAPAIISSGYGFAGHGGYGYHH